MPAKSNKNIIKISITGPESSGKTSLARTLAQHFSTIWVPEYSREYLRMLDNPYDAEDITRICIRQLGLEDELEKKASRFLFCDTDPLVCKIWCEEKFGSCDPLIEKLFLENTYQLYLLCTPDLPWQPDALRENPYDRGRLFELYREQLEYYKLPYYIVKGTSELRSAMAIEAVDGLINM